MSNVIELEEVWKTYRIGEVDVHALCGLNMKIKKGEFVAVLGPSGSGKSTSMFLIGCLDLPSRGKVILDGNDISRLHESHLAQIRGRKIGFVFQRFNLLPTLTVLENVEVPMVFQGVDAEKRRRRAKELLKKVGLENRIYHKPTEISGGEMQRVAIARALGNDPEVVLADEPTGNLDSKTGIEVIRILEDLHKKEGKTVIMVTHDKEIAEHADRKIHLMDGKNVN